MARDQHLITNTSKDDEMSLVKVTLERQDIPASLDRRDADLIEKMDSSEVFFYYYVYSP